ncbi:MAG: hypothetical protein H0V17_27880 [Deltaproteobacteria bacterium]|nr:hypothetical protein [Deltaproteobacteria bacterium]
MMHFDQALLAHIPIPPKLLVALIVLGLALIIWAIVAIASSGKKKHQQFAPNAPMCTTCGAPGRWNYNAWVCDRCQRPIMPGQMGHMGHPGHPPQMGHPGQPQMGHPGQPQMGHLGQPQMGHPGQPPMGMPQPGMAPPQQMAPQGPTCTTCGSPGRWIPESNGWGCDRCRAMIGPSVAPAPPA